MTRSAKIATIDVSSKLSLRPNAAAGGPPPSALMFPELTTGGLVGEDSEGGDDGWLEPVGATKLAAGAEGVGVPTDTMAATAGGLLVFGCTTTCWDLTAGGAEVADGAGGDGAFAVVAGGDAVCVLLRLTGSPGCEVFPVGGAELVVAGLVVAVSVSVGLPVDESVFDGLLEGGQLVLAAAELVG